MINVVEKEWSAEREREENDRGDLGREGTYEGNGNRERD